MSSNSVTIFYYVIDTVYIFLKKERKTQFSDAIYQK